MRGWSAARSGAAAILGAVLGGASAETFGAVSGALLGWLVIRVLAQQSEIATLRRALLPTPTPTPTPMPMPMPTSATVPVAPAARPASPPAAAPDRLAPLRAWFFGGNTIVKVGVAILFIGLAFLARYASERVQVPVEARLAGIAGVALVLLALGWRLRRVRAGYAQVLQGAAVAVLYLTLFAAFRFYGVLPLGPAFALMAVVAALAAVLAVAQEARALAVTGALGGFATPLLVAAGSGDPVALFSYYLVLDLGIAAVAWFRTWRSLNLVGFAGTFLVGSGWGVLAYRPDRYASSQAFLIASFLLFVAVSLMPARRDPADAADHDERADPAAGRRGEAWVQGSLLFGLPTVAFALQYGLVRHAADGAALSAGALAVFYAALAAALRGRPRLALAFEAFIAIGTVFATLVLPLALDARSTAGAWALEGAGLVWLGLRQARVAPRGFGYALLVLSGAALLFGQAGGAAPQSVFNAAFIDALLIGAGSLMAAYALHRMPAPTAPRREPPGRPEGRTAARAARRWSEDAVAEPLAIGWAMLWLVVAAGVQIDAFVAPPFELAAWLVAASAIAALCTLLGQRFDWPRVGLPARAHAAVLALGVVASAAGFASPLDGGGVWAWPVALAVHALVLAGAAPRWPAPWRTAVQATGALVVAALGALLGRALIASAGDIAGAWTWIGWLAGPALLLSWLPGPAAARLWPVRAGPPAYQTVAAGVLAGAALVWVTFANLASDGSAPPLPYVPLLDPLDVGSGAALWVAWRWWRSPAAAPRRDGARQAPPALFAAAAFVWLNAMLIRAFHHLGGVPFRVDAWLGSLAVQTGLTLLWTATALVLMWVAARRAARLPWTAGAALLGAVVVKLAAVDLSGSGTVTRIVSFIGVGALMLVIGYVAPWPGRPDAGGD